MKEEKKGEEGEEEVEEEEEEEVKEKEKGKGKIRGKSPEKKKKQQQKKKKGPVVTTGETSKEARSGVLDREKDKAKRGQDSNEADESEHEPSAASQPRSSSPSKKKRGSLASSASSSSKTPGKVQWDSRRVQVAAQSILEGTPEDEIKGFVERQMELELRENVGEPVEEEEDEEDEEKMPHYPSVLRSPEEVAEMGMGMEVTPPRPSTHSLRHSTGGGGGKPRSSPYPRPQHCSPTKSSPSSSSVVMGGGSQSSPSTVSPGFRHSRLARRGSYAAAASNSAGAGASGPNSPSSPHSNSGNSPKRMSMPPCPSGSGLGVVQYPLQQQQSQTQTQRHPLATSYQLPPPPPQPVVSPSGFPTPTTSNDQEEDVFSPPAHSHSPQTTHARVSKTSTYAQASLGLISPSPSLSSPPASKSPFIHPSTAFDNSPLLLGSGTDRKFSLGRWELRKKSERNVSVREREARREEDELSSRASSQGGGSRAGSVVPEEEDGEDLDPSDSVSQRGGSVAPQAPQTGGLYDLSRDLLGGSGFDEMMGLGIEFGGGDGDGKKKEGFHNGLEDWFEPPTTVRALFAAGGAAGVGVEGGELNAFDEF
ncbi:hypothetical protein T439DRAFT_325099 [Meredithblackwellia eburnea MCA 4105]